MEIFNENQYGHGFDETVGSFMAKKQIEEEKKLRNEYKPTKEEKDVIELLSEPIKNKIKELQNEIDKMPEGGEKKRYEDGINTLLIKLMKIKFPQQMSKDGIKDLLFQANARRDALEEHTSIDNSHKISLLGKEIDFLLDQFGKRSK